MSRSSWLGPLALITPIVVAAGVVLYHALDSWYLQTANASRLRADYAEMAAARLTDRASDALRTPHNTDSVRAVLAELFRTTRLLPRGVPQVGGNAAAFAVMVIDPSGAVIYQSGDPAAFGYVARDTLDADAGGLVISISARKSATAWLATEHLASRMMLIIWLVVLSAVAALVAVRLRARERKLIEARAGFVSSVSHELRTPLAQIQILLETLRMERYNDSAEREWMFDGMQREVSRLTTLVNNVLQFSRAQRGSKRNGGYEGPIDLRSLISETVSGFAPLATARSMEVTADIPSGLTVMANPDEMKQVMLNLLDNAAKYGPAGQTIRVSAQAGGDMCRIMVDDEGSGIPHRDRQRVWEPFERGINAAQSAVAGSGIGLSVVRDIVSAAGGKVEVTDAPGGGARMVIELRRVQDHG
ncbi:MAG TPA: HAMP domain-containing sensor histidine kinase [Gemmatimonadaceae bacterium]